MVLEFLFKAEPIQTVLPEAGIAREMRRLPFALYKTTKPL
jgi:hypothetical protein